MWLDTMSELCQQTFLASNVCDASDCKISGGGASFVTASFLWLACAGTTAALKAKQGNNQVPSNNSGRRTPETLMNENEAEPVVLATTIS